MSIQTESSSREGVASSVGVGHHGPGDADRLFSVRWEAVRRDTSNPAAWESFAFLFARTGFLPDADVSELLDVLLACLAQETLDAQSLAGTAVQLLRRDALMGPLVSVAEGGNTEAVHAALDDTDLMAVLDRGVVLLTLSRMVLPDIAFERVFAQARSLLLGRIQEGISFPPRVMAALARQCFLNGYVWAFGEDEVRQVELLAESLAPRALQPADVPAVCAIAAYVPLMEWDRAAEVAELAGSMGQAWFLNVVLQQIVEPMEERVIREGIPRLGPIDDRVSREVRAQYEEHPYPQWTSVSAVSHDSVASALRQALDREVAPELEMWERPRVLVAGCGTGRQLAQVATRFAGASVTGVDLSLASLAYAARRCGELGFGDVSLVQADILSLEDWHERFDIVECVGVLHHMEDPEKGWRILTTLVRSGGLMRIGLYSELARRDVVRARGLIAREGYDGAPEGIRAARPEIARRFAGSEGHLLKWQDFYSMQECRDLLFHVQEHRFTLPRIQDALDDLGLEFLGFELADAGSLPAFRRRFGGADAEWSLEAWHTFEEENPRTFRGMYQLWARKVAPSSRTLRQARCR